MPVYPVLSVTLGTLIAGCILCKGSGSGRRRGSGQKGVHSSSIQRRMHPMPQPVQPANHLVVRRREGDRVYVAPSSLGDTTGGVSGAVNEVPVMDHATTDFLGIATDIHAQQHVLSAIKMYGVGSCGPRGFFGTITPHIMVERELSALFNQPAILYPSAAVAVPSALPIVCSKGDVLFVPQVHSLEIARAAALCGATVVTVPLQYLNLRDVIETTLKSRQTDTDSVSHLKETICSYITREDVAAVLSRTRKALETAFARGSADSKNTCWLLADTITRDGILFLPDVLQLCERHHIRTFINDGLSLGVLGARGRGVPEFWCDMGYCTDHHSFDLVAGSLEHALSGLGGVCTGSLHLVEQQRNMGLGYCFSASAPPGLCECIRYALRKMDSVRPTLQRSVEALHSALIAAGVPFVGVPHMPLVYIQTPPGTDSTTVQQRLLSDVHGPRNLRFLVAIVDAETVRASTTAAATAGLEPTDRNTFVELAEAVRSALSP